jgi:hypothetical protein
MIIYQHKSSNLFDRVPADIFRPLVGQNQRRMWELLERLYNVLFGPDAIPPQEDGFLQRDLTIEIERYLQNSQPWQDDSEELEEGAPLNIQANLILNRLIDTGWMKSERVGVRTFINMHPIVLRLFETLNQFVHEGPQLIGGKVQMIYNQLCHVMENPTAQAQGFQSAAQESIRLINTLNATAVRVKDILANLGQKDETQVFVQRFFGEYVSTLYVRDYQQLRTENHPLKHRWEIVTMVESLRDDPVKRRSLIQGYADISRPGNEDPESMFESDVQRFLRFVDIERYLDRLDHSVNEATRRSVAFLTYRLKTSDRLELSIDQAIMAVLNSDKNGFSIEGRLIPPGQCLSEERLRQPIIKAKAQPKVFIRKREMTPREKALVTLRMAMIKSRIVSDKVLLTYLDKNMGSQLEIDSDHFEIKTVEDACAFLTLSKLALYHLVSKSSKLPMHSLLKGVPIEIESQLGERTISPLIDGPMFKVRKRV